MDAKKHGVHQTHVRTSHCIHAVSSTWATPHTVSCPTAAPSRVQLEIWRCCCGANRFVMWRQFRAKPRDWKCSGWAWGMAPSVWESPPLFMTIAFVSAHTDNFGRICCIVTSLHVYRAAPRAMQRGKVQPLFKATHVHVKAREIEQAYAGRWVGQACPMPAQTENRLCACIHTLITRHACSPNTFV